jgi:hypothetical protein
MIDWYMVGSKVRHFHKIQELVDEIASPAFGGFAMTPRSRLFWLSAFGQAKLMWVRRSLRASAGGGCEAITTGKQERLNPSQPD